MAVNTDVFGDDLEAILASFENNEELEKEFVNYV